LHNELFLDVNVIMYAAGESSEYKESCVNVLHKVQRGDLKVAIDTEVLQELLYRHHSLRLREEGVKLALYTPRLKPRDALHLAVMLNNDIKKVITVDQHFEKVIREVERIDPKSLI